MKPNWNFLGGGRGVQNKIPSVGGGGGWIFSGAAQLKKYLLQIMYPPHPRVEINPTNWL